jgi:uroporphyrinogen-III synthase
MKSIFISKNEEEIELLIQFCINNELKLFAKSGIKIEFIHFKEPEAYEILFFGSKNSVISYFNMFKPKPNCLIACAGNSTSKLLNTFGFKSDYTATTVDEKSVADFTNWVKEKIVFFPSSNKSLQTFGKQLEENQRLFETAYKTHVLEFPREALADICVFTSPSNVDTFHNSFKAYTIETAIAWGESTKRQIENKLKYMKIISLEEPTLQALMKALNDYV